MCRVPRHLRKHNGYPQPHRQSPKQARVVKRCGVCAFRARLGERRHGCVRSLGTATGRRCDLRQTPISYPPPSIQREATSSTCTLGNNACARTDHA